MDEASLIFVPLFNESVLFPPVRSPGIRESNSSRKLFFMSFQKCIARNYLPCRCRLIATPIEDQMKIIPRSDCRPNIPFNLHSSPISTQLSQSPGRMRSRAQPKLICFLTNSHLKNRTWERVGDWGPIFDARTTTERTNVLENADLEMNFWRRFDMRKRSRPDIWNGHLSGPTRAWNAQ